MSNDNLVIDVRLEESSSSEILKIPIITQLNINEINLKFNVKDAFQKGSKSAIASFETHLQYIGNAFGKDISQWEQIGEEKVDITEEGEIRTIKKTGMFSGIELELYQEMSYYDERIKLSKTKGNALGNKYNIKSQKITNEEEWQKMLVDQPMTMSQRYEELGEYILSKFENENTELYIEACHALWELSINKELHKYINAHMISHVTKFIDISNIKMAYISTSVIWCLALTEAKRKIMIEHDTILKLIELLKETMKQNINEKNLVQDKDGNEKEEFEDYEIEELQICVLNTLFVLMVDVKCRNELIEADNDFSTLFNACKTQTDIKLINKRRILSFKILLSMIQRDHNMRIKAIQRNIIDFILEILNEDMNYTQMKYYISAIISSFILDETVMELICNKNESFKLFECCIKILKHTIESFSMTNDKINEFNINVLLAEGFAQGVWGSAYYCCVKFPELITIDHILFLSQMAIHCTKYTNIALGTVLHCLSATLANFCSETSCAEKMMSDPEDSILKTLLALVSVEDCDFLKGSGHIQAAACTGLAFLACHPIGAKGEACMFGPYREKLLNMGVFGVLLSRALNPPKDPNCNNIVQQAAAVGVMYLSTMAGDLEHSNLSNLSSLMCESTNIEMVEYLMAAMWILLRNPNNRRVLSHSLVNMSSDTISKKLQDTIDVHDVTNDKIQQITNKKSKEIDNDDEDWGLSALVTVGEKWLPTALEITNDDKDAPLLKLFEFLTASLCLFLVPEDDIHTEITYINKYYNIALNSMLDNWWTIEDDNNDIKKENLTPLTYRTMRLLIKLLHLTIPRAWKVIQLSCITLWNVTYRSNEAEKYIIEIGICIALLDIINSDYWPASLRNCAAGLLQSFSEKSVNFEHNGGLTPYVTSLVTLIDTQIPLLELMGAQGLARSTFHAPEGCLNQKIFLNEIKLEVKIRNGIKSLIALIKRLNKRYMLLMNGEELKNAQFSSMNLNDNQCENDDDDPVQYERPMNNLSAVIETYKITFIALLNLSIIKKNQVEIGKHGLETLLGTNNLISKGRNYNELNDDELYLIYLCSAIIHNLSLHTKNRTKLYKAELKGSVIFGKTFRLEDPKAYFFNENSYYPNNNSQNILLNKYIESNNEYERNRNTLSLSTGDHRPKIILPVICDTPSTTTCNNNVALEKMNSKSSDKNDKNVKIKRETADEKFLKWIDKTFEYEKNEIEEKYQKGDKKEIVDEYGNYLDERFSLSYLHQSLRRPLNHICEKVPFLERGTWKPIVYEYIQSQSEDEMNPMCNKLFTTDIPFELKNYKKQNEKESYELNRPTFEDRMNGRIPITKVDKRYLDSLNIINTNNQSSLQLKIAMSSIHTSTQISFKQNICNYNNNVKKPHMTVFEHIKGSKVYDTLFDDYILPNGKRVYYYYHGGSIVNEIEVKRLPPPAKPLSIPAALQQGMPLTEVLNIIAKPPGSGCKFSFKVPIPKLSDVPKRHTLNVKESDKMKWNNFGDLKENNIQMTLVIKKIMENKTTTMIEKIDVLLSEEEREPWTLQNSVFKPRTRESDSKSYYDTPKVMDQMFERDWNRCCHKDKFTSMIFRESKNSKETYKDDASILNNIRTSIKRYYHIFIPVFVYYAAMGSGDPFHMTLNSYTSFLDDCNIPDAESMAVKRSDCDTIFIIANFIMDKKSKEYLVNNEQALMRYEFMEAIIRLGIAKYIKNQEAESISESINIFYEKNIIPNLPNQTYLDSNKFREFQLYNENVDLLFKKHLNLLKNIYSRYRLKPNAGGLRPKLLKISGWLLLMDDAKLIDSQFTLQDAHLCYLWSRMLVIDEIKDYNKYESMTFIDFLEALGRVAYVKNLPTSMEIKEQGFDNIFEWARARDEETLMLTNRAGTDESRPLYAKLDCLLDLIFRRLYFDPMQPENEFSIEALTKIIKKIDKDMGP